MLTKALVQRQFRRGDWRSVLSVGAVGPVARSFGDNSGATPFRIAVSKGLADELVRKIDDYAPYWPTEIHWRLWVIGVDQQAALKVFIENYLSGRTEPARKSWRELDCTEDPALLGLEIKRAAEDAGFEVWDDQDLEIDLERAARQQARKEMA